MRYFQPSEEYLEAVSQWLLEWVEDPEAYVFTQFLSKYGIGYNFFKFMEYNDDRISNAFEVVKAKLHNRWIKLALEEKNMPIHKSKVLMRYLRLYDSHGLDIEFRLKTAIAEAEVIGDMKRYKIEKYGTDQLSGPYRKIYDSNIDKCGDREKAK